MYETDPEIARLDALLSRSREGATPHLKQIVSGDHVLGAADLLPLLDGMRVLSLATVTRAGEPRVSAVDGHFIHGRWTFGTEGSSAKARHLAERPAVSVAWIDGERIGVFAHGTAVPIDDGDELGSRIITHWTDHYGSDPRTWGDDVRMFAVDPTWMVGYRGTG